MSMLQTHWFHVNTQGETMGLQVVLEDLQDLDEEWGLDHHGLEWVEWVARQRLPAWQMTVGARRKPGPPGVCWCTTSQSQPSCSLTSSL